MSSSPRARPRQRVTGALGLLVLVAAVIVAIALATDGGSDPAPAAGPPAATGFARVVSAASPSVVQIRSARGLGSGIVYDGDGHIVTNAHVVAGSRRFQVTAADGTTYPGRLIGAFPQGDLAVIGIPAGRIAPARFANSSRVRAGDYALAIGNPLGLRSSVTQGIVSATSRTVSEGDGIALPAVIQTSAAINPGNSGGALVDAGGAVIGVPTLAALDPELGGSAAPGIGFAISSNTVRAIAPQLIAHGKVSASGRAWLGVDLRAMANGRVLIAGNVAGGPSAKADLPVGAQIVAVGGRPVANADDVALALAAHKPGDRVMVAIAGPSGTRDIAVTLGQTPG